jgi:hypothetical protein
VRTARAQAIVPLSPRAALELWSDPRRWTSFVEGFARVLERSQEWPAKGAKLVWESGPGGRGRVTERVSERGADRFATQVFEDALVGTQRLTAIESPGGTRVLLELEYTLVKYGPLAGVADAIFIRRALRDALTRTLRAFSVEAQEEAGLR